MKVAVIANNGSAILDYYENENVKNFVDGSIKKILTKLKRRKGITCLSGLSRDIEQNFCHICESLKIPYSAYIPFEGQELAWPKPIKDRYHDLIDNAEDVVFSDYGSYSPRKIKLRDRLIIDEASIVIIVWDKRESGRAFDCLNYTKETEDKKVIVIDMVGLTVNEY